MPNNLKLLRANDHRFALIKLDYAQTGSHTTGEFCAELLEAT